jgi:hypothetical protein
VGLHQAPPRSVTLYSIATHRVSYTEFGSNAVADEDVDVETNVETNVEADVDALGDEVPDVEFAAEALGDKVPDAVETILLYET